MLVRAIARALVLMAGAASLTACEYSPTTVDRTIAYNQSIAESTNDLFLINALRAFQRQPTYYTRNTANTSTGTITPTESGVFPWGSTPSVTKTIASTYTTSGAVSTLTGQTITAAAGLTKAALGLTSSLTGTVSNQLTLGNADDQPSMNGLLTPVALQQIANYLNEGYNSEELYMLYLSSITLSKKVAEQLPQAAGENCYYESTYNAHCSRYSGDPNCFRTSAADPEHIVYLNDPANDKLGTTGNVRNYKCFKQVLAALLALDLKPATSTSRDVLYVLPFELAKNDPRYFADLTQQGLEISVESGRRGSGSVDVCKKTDSLALGVNSKHLSPANAQLLNPTGSAPAAEPANTGYFQTLPIFARSAAAASKDPCRDAAHPTPDPTKSESKGTAGVSYAPRSLEGIVYYLGEIIRHKYPNTDSGATGDAVTFWNTADANNGYDEELFDVEKGFPAEGAISVAKTETGMYYVPRLCPHPDSGRYSLGCRFEYPDHASAQVLTMLNQLWGLNKTQATAPIVAPVTVISSH